MKKFILLAIILVLSYTLSAQDDGFYGPTQTEDAKTKKNRKGANPGNWSFGGNFWLSWGTTSAFVEVSPIAMYRVSPRLSTGIGFTYIYQKWENLYFDSIYYTQNISRNIYGPRVVTQFTLLSGLDEMININIGNIILYGEYAHLSTDRLFRNTNSNEVIYDGKEWTSNLLLGGGIFQPVGGRGGGLSLIILYNVFENEFSPYSNPVIRIGFFF